MGSLVAGAQAAPAEVWGLAGTWDPGPRTARGWEGPCPEAAAWRAVCTAVTHLADFNCGDSRDKRHPKITGRSGGRGWEMLAAVCWSQAVFGKTPRGRERLRKPPGFVGWGAGAPRQVRTSLDSDKDKAAGSGGTPLTALGSLLSFALSGEAGSVERSTSELCVPQAQGFWNRGPWGPRGSES